MARFSARRPVRRTIAAGLLCAGLLVGWAPARAQLPAGAVASVDGQPISETEYLAYVVELAKQRFWHRSAAGDKLEELKRDAVERLVLYRLMASEGDRRGIAADTAAVERRIDGYRKRMQNDQARSTFEGHVPQLRQQLVEAARIEALENTVRRVADPTDAELRAFYKENRDAFTEPAGQRVSIVLIAVSPSATQDEWLSARAKAQQIADQARAGADFAQLARQHSKDPSAAAGGDMGYVHAGTLGDAAHATLDRLAVGEISPPVHVLQGYAVFRVAEHRAAKLHAFEAVRERALELYRRDTAERQWTDFTQALRSRAQVVVRSSLPDPSAIAR